MAKPLLPTAEEIQRLRKIAEDPCDPGRLRAQAILEVAGGESLRDNARRLGYARHTYTNWLPKFRRTGKLGIFPVRLKSRKIKPNRVTSSTADDRYVNIQDVVNLLRVPPRIIVLFVNVGILRGRESKNHAGYRDEGDHADDHWEISAQSVAESFPRSLGLDKDDAEKP